MINSAEIVSFLKNLGLVSRDLGNAASSSEIKGLATFEEAAPNDLAWISHKRYAQRPLDWLGFRGGLLIVPDTVVEQAPGSFGVVACPNPKLAFIRAADHFFQSLTVIEMPKVGDLPVSSNAVIGENVSISAGVVIGSNVVIENGVWIGPNSVLANCRVGAGTRIGSNCSIGLPGFGYEKDEEGRYWRFPHIGKVLIGRGADIGSNTCIDRGALGDTIIEDGCKIDNLVHIAHNVRIGKNSVVIANSLIGGSAVIGEHAWLAPSVSVLNQVTIGSHALLGMGAVVLKNVESGQTIVGNPGKELRRNK